MTSSYGNLFDYAATVLVQPVATQTGDPVTSYLAELEHTASGKRATHRALVLACVREHPGLCAEEVGEQTGLGRVEAARRLSDARALGEVERRERVKYHGTAQSRWWTL